MNPERWRQLEDLYYTVLERPPSERAAFLLETCPNDTELRREAESLMAHEGQADGLLERPLWNPFTASVEMGSVVGGYRISEKLGSGGMGDVYRATDSKLQREVALKVLPGGAAHDARWIHRLRNEARVLASLNHPHIAAIYGLEEADGVCAIAMELVEGVTLAERMARGRISIPESLAIAQQIAEALAYAHGKGIVHRDLKPANIMVTSAGQIKLVDFGIAQRARLAGTEADAPAETGEIAGTDGYMSPEQLVGLPADHRSDLFSLGVILDQMIVDSQVPGKLKAVIGKLLEKDPVNRFAGAAQVQAELKAVETSLTPVPSVRLSRNARVAVWAAVVLSFVLAGWVWRRSSRRQWARDTTTEIARLVDAGEYLNAAALTRRARAILPRDSALEKLWMRETGEVSIASVPSGAAVSVRPYRGDTNAWQTLGTTPVQKVRMPRQAYVWRIAKPGFTPAFFIGEPPDVPPPGFHYSFNVTFRLRPEGSVPPEMVPVRGGTTALAYPLGTSVNVRIDDFLIDRQEVTNDEYKKFVDAGGYRKREFWKQPFVRGGRTISWDDAMVLFHDSTGRPGPATWEMGGYPKDRAKYPVAGVSWYEAAAYAEFEGKSLPTAYHWTLASQAMGYSGLITPGSNFGNGGIQAVGSDRSASGSGTTDMAGNVKEWCLNEARDGKRFILGGGAGEPHYMFLHTDAQSPWDRLATFGFRCVKLDSPPSAAATARVEATTRNYWDEKPVSEDVFHAYSALYSYDKGELNAQVEETATMDGWSRAKVTFDAAYSHERLTAYLFLPRNALPPFQTAVYFPGAGAFEDDKLDLGNVEEVNDFLLKSGRALMVPVYKGMYQRRDGLKSGGKPPAFFRDHVIAWVKDLGRSIDYLETRPDIDTTRVAYLGASLGGTQGALIPALEKRLKAAILLSGGLPNRHDLPEVDPFNFVSRVTIPVLMLSGRYDNSFPLESSQRPLFHFLATPNKDKKMVVYEDGHGAFPRPDAARECLNWLDKYLGPVRR